MTSSEQIYIHRKQVYVNKNENQAIYFGYELTLTKTEYLILKAIADSSNSPLSAEQISAQTGIELSKENVAFHISSINKKAKIISNRTLIKNIAKIGYFLGEEI